MKKRCNMKLASRAQAGHRLLVSALLLCPTVAMADIMPGAGTLIPQSSSFKLPPIPQFHLQVEQDDERPTLGDTPFLVRRIQINGNSLFDSATLHALVADMEGQNLSLAQLGRAAARIKAYYVERGEKMMRVVIPTQMISDGRVRIQVIEARYGQVVLQNQSGVSDALLQATLAPLQSGSAIEGKQLERALLLLSDIPGANTKASLGRSVTTGTNDLLVNAGAVPAVKGFVALDNNGNAYTGKLRLHSTVNIVAPLKQGDVLSLGGLSSGRDMKFASLSYKLLLNGYGTGLGGSYSRLHYRLGGTLAAVDGQGDAAVASLWLRQPLLRSPSANLYGQIQQEQLQLRDHLLRDTIRSDRRLQNSSLSVIGDLSDRLLFGASNYVRLDWLNGQVQFIDATARQNDAAQAQTDGRFTKANVRLSRLQRLAPNDSVSIDLSGQWASNNLDAAQKMSVGGPNSVRAYDVGALSADSGALGTLEWRHDFGIAWGGQIQSALFIDAARVRINKQPWLNTTNAANVHGAGLAVNWTWSDHWQVRLQMARQLGAPPEQIRNSAPGRVWVELNREL